MGLCGFQCAKNLAYTLYGSYPEMNAAAKLNFHFCFVLKPAHDIFSSAVHWFREQECSLTLLASTHLKMVMKKLMRFHQYTLANREKT